MDPASVATNVERVLLKARSELLRRGTLDAASLIRDALSGDEDARLSRADLDDALQSVGVFLSKTELGSLFRGFVGEDGRVRGGEVVLAIRGAMSERRRRLVQRVFGMLDDGTHLLSREDALRVVKGSADSRVVDFVSGRRDLTEEEFLEYYEGLSARTLDDGAFVQILEDTWSVGERVSDVEHMGELMKLFARRIEDKRRGSETLHEAGRRIFAFFDLNDNGRVDRREFFQVCTHLGVASEERLMGALFDKHCGGDGLLDSAEFADLVIATVDGRHLLEHF